MRDQLDRSRHDGDITDLRSEARLRLKADANCITTRDIVFQSRDGDDQLEDEIDEKADHVQLQRLGAEVER